MGMVTTSKKARNTGSSEKELKLLVKNMLDFDLYLSVSLAKLQVLAIYVQGRIAVRDFL